MTNKMNSDVPTTADEMRAARKKRNRAVLGLIFGMCVLFYVITIVRMSV